MHRPIDQAAAFERARWLADLAEAIEQAQRIVWQLGVVEGDSAEAKELYARLEGARVEADALRVGGHREVDPAWIRELLGRSSLLQMRP